MSERYQSEYEKVKKILQAALHSDTSYGVRREFRIGGAALEPMFESIDQSVSSLTILFGMTDWIIQVTELVGSNSILWIPGQIWFKFTLERMQAIHSVQRSLFRRQPENYGNLSGILSFMQQSVHSTPRRVETFVRLNLAALQYNGVVDRFGMFFLHNLDMKALDSDNVLPEITPRDEYAVVKLLPVLSHRNTAATLPEADGAAEDRSELHPLGKKPSWDQVAQMLELNPSRLMEDWQWLSALDVYKECNNPDALHKLAADMFRMFTRHIWIELNKAHKYDVSVQQIPDIETALQFWTIGAMYDRLKAAHFCSVNVGEFQVSGRARAHFGDDARVKLLFGELDMGPSWNRLGTAYLEKYAKKMKELDAEEQDEFREYLGDLLGYCQSLPDSDTRHPWRTDREGRVLLLANPVYYKVETIVSTEKGKKRVRGVQVRAGEGEFYAGVFRAEASDSDEMDENAGARAARKFQRMIRGRGGTERGQGRGRGRSCGRGRGRGNKSGQRK